MTQGKTFKKDYAITQTPKTSRKPTILQQSEEVSSTLTTKFQRKIRL